MSVLVAYASKNGSTAEIAEAIADELRAEGCGADCAEVSTIENIDGYETVVLGSAMYMKRWRPEARRFLRRYSKALAGRDLWIFSSGPIGEQAKNPDPNWTVPTRVVARAEELGAHPHMVFAGRVPTEPHNFVERAMLRDTPPELQDMRDWMAIREWAQAIARETRSQRQPRSTAAV